MNKEAFFAILIIVPLFLVLIANQRWISERTLEHLTAHTQIDAKPKPLAVKKTEPSESELLETNDALSAIPQYEDPASYEAVLTPVDEYWLEESETSESGSFTQANGS